MKLLPLIIISAISASAAEVHGWKLVWSDEFDKPGRPDPSKWGYEKGLVRNNEKQFYTVDRRENARVEDGLLVIEARKEAMDGAEFTSASMISKGHGEWKYGRIEVKAKLPAARGTWPAIWMLPGDIGKVPWPLCGEIDIMEHVGHDPDGIHGTLHSGTFNHTKHNGRGTRTSVPTATRAFHVYSIDWTDGRIVMAVDGKPYATYDRKPGDTVAEWPFDKPFYLILNLAVGGAWGGREGVDEAAFPQRMEVDHVRVYQKTG